MHLLVAEEDFWTLPWTITTPFWIFAASRTPPLVGLWLHSSWLASHTHSLHSCHLPSSTVLHIHTHTHHFFITFLSNTHFQQSLPTLSNTHSHLHLTLFQLPTLIFNNHVTVHCSSIYLLTTMWGMDSILAQDPAILIVFWHGLCALPKGI